MAAQRRAPCGCQYVIRDGLVLAWKDCRPHGGSSRYWPPPPLADAVDGDSLAARRQAEAAEAARHLDEPAEGGDSW